MLFMYSVAYEGCPIYMFATFFGYACCLCICVRTSVMSIDDQLIFSTVISRVSSYLRFVVVHNQASSKQAETKSFQPILRPVGAQVRWQ